MMKIRRSHLPYLILLGPIASGLLRKVAPGQPAAVEAAPSVIFAILVSVGLLRFSRPSSQSLAILALFWFALYFFYSIPAMAISPLLGVQAFLLASVGPVLALSTLNNNSAMDAQFALSAMKAFAIVIAGQFVIGLVMLQYGNAALPYIFRANLNEISIGKEFRIGQPMLAGYFTTAPVNSIVSLCAFGVACALFLRERSHKRALIWLVVAILIIAVVWMTARRGAFFACIIIALITISVSLLKPRGAATWMILLPGIILVGLLGFSGTDRFDLLFGDRIILLSAGGLDLAMRFSEVFLRFLLFWMAEAPFGNYTGYASGVGKAFGVRDLETAAAEVGGAMIVAEHGIIGLFLFVAFVGVALWVMIQKTIASGENWLWPLIFTHFSLFVIFFFKENSAMFPGFFGFLFFWALPGMVVMYCRNSAISDLKLKSI